MTNVFRIELAKNCLSHMKRLALDAAKQGDTETLHKISHKLHFIKVRNYQIFEKTEVTTVDQLIQVEDCKTRLPEDIISLSIELVDLEVKAA